MDSLTTISIFGVATVVIVPALIAYFKSLGLASRFAPFVALGLFQALGLLTMLMQVYPEITPWVRIILGGLLAAASIGVREVTVRSNVVSDVAARTKANARRKAS
ncbi:MAG TPA: hypothetical protein VF914_21075 [Chloroflexia bacterium]|jgi:hypothetical protein